MGTIYIYICIYIYTPLGFGLEEIRKWLVYTISWCICNLLQYATKHQRRAAPPVVVCVRCIFDLIAYTTGHVRSQVMESCFAQKPPNLCSICAPLFAFHLRSAGRPPAAHRPPTGRHRPPIGRRLGLDAPVGLMGPMVPWGPLGPTGPIPNDSNDTHNPKYTPFLLPLKFP